MRSPSPARAGLVIMTGTGRGVAVVRAGFSLIETVLALVVVLMLATLVAPSLVSMSGEARAERAKAEIAAAMSDARSLARARGMPVVVSVLGASGGEDESEIVGVVVAAGGLEDAMNAADAGDGEDETVAAATGEAGAMASEPEADADAEEAAGNAMVGSAKRRLGVLPAGCEIRLATGETAPGAGTTGGTASGEELNPSAEPAAKTATGGGAARAAVTMIAVVFPDGTASVPRRKLELVVARKGRGAGGDRVFAIAVSPWFAEASFVEKVAAVAAGEEKESDAAETEGAAEAAPAGAEPVSETR